MDEHREPLSAVELIANIARCTRERSPDGVLRQRKHWQRICWEWSSANPVDTTDDEARALIRFIATERLEESAANISWQRDNWQRRCAELVDQRE